MTGKADLAVLWEPDVSRALAQPGVVKILGTEDTRRLIVDILIVNRKFSTDQPQLVSLLLNNYFHVLKNYRDDAELLKTQIKAETGLSDEAVATMLKGVSWVNFGRNCENWFDVAAPGTFAEEGLVDTIYSASSILVNAGDFKSTPIPDNDPYRLINSSFLEELYAKGFSGFVSASDASSGAAGSLETRFPYLDEAGWSSLKEVGALKIEPIIFQSGTGDLDLLAKQVIDQAVAKLQHYPNFRVIIKGHTGTRGDPDQNKSLSADRAEAVAKYLEITYNVDPNRLHAVGMGGEEPLPREAKRIQAGL